MFKLKNKYCQIAIIVLLMITSFKTNGENLLKPTGTYGVGYRDVFLINTDICPDIFYKNRINESDFSPENKNHCHEIAIRIYYPSESSIKLSDKYYEPSLIDRNLWIEEHNELSKQNILKLNSLFEVQTFTAANAKPIKNEKFPTIVFLPGSGAGAQTYNNYISDLVSHGYIVIGVNSLFLNGGISLSNGHIVRSPASYLDVHGRNENLKDLIFVIKNLKELASKANLSNEMDLNNIALIGHSRGGMSIVNYLKQNTHVGNIKAVMLLDPGNLLKEKNYPIPKFVLPTMTIWSSKFKIDFQGSVLLGKNNYEVILKNKNSEDTFSDHMNFSDDSTLQYHPAYQIPTTEKVSVGKGNGYELSKIINSYTLVFLDSFLKNDSNQYQHLLACKNLNKDSTLLCGWKENK